MIMYLGRRFSGVIKKRLDYDGVRSTTTTNTNVTYTKNHDDDNTQQKPWHEIPCPPTLPVVGQLFNFLPGGIFYSKKEKWPEIMYKTYGPIVKFEGSFGSPPMTFLYEPGAAFHIFRNENWMPLRPGFQSLEYFRKHYKRKETDNPEECTGLLTEHGETWRKFRTTVNQVLLQPKTIKLYSDTLTEVASDMVKRF